MPQLFIWSQVLGGISMGISITAAQIKNRTIMRIMLFVSSLFRGAHFLLLGVPQAGIVTFIAGSRWLTSIFTHKKIVKIFFIVLVLGIGIWRLDSVIGTLPIISTVLGTLAAFTPKDRNMRIYIIVAMILWIIHNIYVFTPIGIASSAFSLVSHFIGYERFYHHNHIQFHLRQPVHNEQCPNTPSR